MHEADSLGASLYIPATHSDVPRVCAAEKLTQVRSIIFCTEDSVLEKDVPAALANLAQALPSLCRSPQRKRFVRVRSVDVLRDVLQLAGIDRVDGFVLPKVTAENLPHYMDLLAGTAHVVMPTLESREVFSDHEMGRLLAVLDSPAVRDRILALRIGGNDLLNLIGLRRQRGRTIYETPIGPVIARLVTTFRPFGFRLSAPVFEYLDDHDTLDREVQQDLLHGLTGKTAIHPEQIGHIERHYRVRGIDISAAQQILDVDARSVFRFDNAMCEPATHRNWALSVMNAARHFGMVEPVAEFPRRRVSGGGALSAAQNRLLSKQ